MDVVAIRRALDDVFDQAIVYHAFTDYMRDYEMLVYATSDPRLAVPAEHLRYLFRYCVEVDVRPAVTPEVWKQSLDDRLIDHETGKDLDGYVWGVKWQALYPGATLLDDSPRAQAWSDAIGIDFHEVRIETNGHNLTLIFNDLSVTPVSDGYAPFTVDEST
ncbi:hypothetical protein I6A84_05305 [Frankia sp. CNm7]|uniref:YxiG-like domain-containing protein n=1 Tax=Frankia nepalensis TaxID=1836974 RepID=A0A937RIN1_9ACTN|nr:hypothetical protein [Frankia nepalensis]MBL7497651.1 hypothetical protein [Frankia nepalensis]MBL7510034.1 hypothetical protein [Frankia nepalensis]MBL7517556.1 hypothetical protein [Frankia nepalensis]MBL7631055.1 hypothetical protein [Frankia nepalensis]